MKRILILLLMLAACGEPERLPGRSYELVMAREGKVVTLESRMTFDDCEVRATYHYQQTGEAPFCRPMN